MLLSSILDNLSPKYYLVFSKNVMNVKPVHSVCSGREITYCYKTDDGQVETLKNCNLVELSDGQVMALRSLEFDISESKEKLHELGLRVKNSRRQFDLQCGSIISNNDVIRVGGKTVFGNKYFNEAKMSIDIQGRTIIDLYKNSKHFVSASEDLFNLLKNASNILQFKTSLNPPDEDNKPCSILIYKSKSRFTTINKKLKEITKKELDELFIKIDKLSEQIEPEYITKFNNDIY